MSDFGDPVQRLCMGGWNRTAGRLDSLISELQDVHTCLGYGIQKRSSLGVAKKTIFPADITFRYNLVHSSLFVSDIQLLC